MTVDEIREELGYEPLKEQEDTIEDESETNSNPNDTTPQNEEETLKSLKNDNKEIISEQLSERILEYLEDKGESQEELLEEYDLLDVEDVKGDINLSKQELVKRKFYVKSSPDLGSYEDSAFALLKIRYRYVPASGETAIKSTSRNFCIRMMRHTANGKIFRKK